MKLKSLLFAAAITLGSSVSAFAAEKDVVDTAKEAGHLRVKGNGAVGEEALHEIVFCRGHRTPQPLTDGGCSPRLTGV